MCNHNQAESDCYYCCGRCRIWFDDFKRLTLAPKWSGQWACNNGVMRATDTDQKQVNWLINSGDFYGDLASKDVHFDIYCETDGGTVSIQTYPGNPSVVIGLKFGTGSNITGAVQISTTSFYHFHTSYTLNVDTWYRVKMQWSKIKNVGWTCTLSIDGSEVDTFTLAAPVNYVFNTIALTNRRTINNNNTFIVNSDPFPSETGALSTVQIRNWCGNVRKYFDPDITFTNFEYCNDPVWEHPVGDGAKASASLTISGAAEAALNNTFTLGFNAFSGFGEGGWFNQYTSGIHPFTTNTGYYLYQLGCRFGWHYTEFRVRLRNNAGTLFNESIFRDYDQPASLPVTKAYADMERITHQQNIGALSWAAVFGTSIQFAIA